MSELKLEVGRRIAEVRKQNGDSQMVCADKLGIKRGTLAAYETGASAMPDVVKSKFVRIYNITYEYLISGSRLLSEPSPEYKKRDLVSLLDQLEDNPLNHEIRRRVLTLIDQSARQKDKIIELYEQVNELSADQEA